jgi:hypothetical protein
MTPDGCIEQQFWEIFSLESLASGLCARQLGSWGGLKQPSSTLIGMAATVPGIKSCQCARRLCRLWQITLPTPDIRDRTQLAGCLRTYPDAGCKDRLPLAPSMLARGADWDIKHGDAASPAEVIHNGQGLPCFGCRQLTESLSRKASWFDYC